jgi:hypothetical protein
MDGPTALEFLRASSPTAPTVLTSAAPQRQHAEFAPQTAATLSQMPTIRREATQCGIDVAMEESRLGSQGDISTPIRWPRRRGQAASVGFRGPAP